MKKIILLGIAGVLLTFTTVACNQTTVEETTELENPMINAKIAINIEGIVTEIEDNKIILDSGKVVIITEQTAFETQNVAEIVPINDQIVVGNFIQGFTTGDPTASEIIADVISANQKP